MYIEVLYIHLAGGPLHSPIRFPSSTGAVQKSVTLRSVFMLMQLNKCVVVCVIHTSGWWPPPFTHQIPILYGSRPEIRDLAQCVYVDAVE